MMLDDVCRVDVSPIVRFRATCAPSSPPERDDAMLAYTDRKAGECVDYNMIATRNSVDNYPRMKTWRTDTFKVGDNNKKYTGYCRFQPVNPCPCDTRKYKASMKQQGARKCPTRFYDPSCGPYDSATFVRTDANIQPSDPVLTCTASDYLPVDAKDPYRGRVSVVVSGTFDSPNAAKPLGFGADCNKVRGVKGVVCSRTPEAYSDSQALQGAVQVMPRGTSNNYPLQTGLPGRTLKGAYPVNVMIEDPNSGDVSVASLPACAASRGHVTITSGNIPRIRLQPDEAEKQGLDVSKVRLVL